MNGYSINRLLDPYPGLLSSRARRARYYFGAKFSAKSSFPRNLARIGANLSKILKKFFNLFFRRAQSAVISNKYTADCARFLF